DIERPFGYPGLFRICLCMNSQTRRNAESQYQPDYCEQRSNSICFLVDQSVHFLTSCINLNFRFIYLPYTHKRLIERLCSFLHFSSHNFTSPKEARRFSLERSFINFSMNNMPYPFSPYLLNSTKGLSISSFSIHSQMASAMAPLSLKAKKIPWDASLQKKTE